MTALPCGPAMVKYILFALNFCFFVCGTVILIVSAYVLIGGDDLPFTDVIEDNAHLFGAALVLLVIVGAAIFVVGFLGCCGACKESASMLWLYAFLLGVILVVQFAGAIIAAVYKDEFDSKLEKTMVDIAQSKVEPAINSSDTKVYAFQEIQFNLKCCGAVDFTDYKDSDNFGTNNTAQPVPKTCCKFPSTVKPDKWEAANPSDAQTCYTEAKTWNANATTTELYTEGCYPKLKTWLKGKLALVVAVSFGLIVFEILCIVFACVVRSAIKDKEGYEKH